jgi:hypothetical protein
MKQSITLLASIVILLSRCTGSGSADFKLIQSQKAGDYTVSILSSTGTMKNGASTYALEFRRTSENQLVDVGKVDVSAVMEMAGMAPMMGTAEVSPTGTPGRYEVKGNLTMAGLWKMNVKFGDQNVRFSLNAD